MNYRDNKTGEPVSILGYGCMRFTSKGTGIDIDKAEQEVMEGIRLGINYFDTAYIYPGSEAALGEILERNHIREKVNIATKLPQYMIGSVNTAEKLFREELKRLRTDYVDYYLMHHITDSAQWKKLQSLGIEEWIAEKKASGQIRNIGFSYHGNTEEFIKTLNGYDWDFCMIQYNYADETAQAGRAGLEAAAAKGVPVMIMEPLRGGKLVGLLPDEAKHLIAQSTLRQKTSGDAQSAVGYTPAELAFRWLWDQPEVTCVLSGMNSMEMVQENCRIASDAKAGSFGEEEKNLISQVKEILIRTEKVPCTGCRYCMPCPKGVDIPSIFRCYNRMYSEKKFSGWAEYAQTVELRKNPGMASLCVGCGKCEKHCPQDIKIREKLKEADKSLRPFWYKGGMAVARAFMFRKIK